MVSSHKMKLKKWKHKLKLNNFLNGSLNSKNESTPVYVSTPPGIPNSEKNVDALETNEQISKDQRTDWNLVGELRVRILEARGLNSKRNIYCTLGLDDVKIQSSYAICKSKVWWDKEYHQLNIYDVTSTLELQVFGAGIITDGLLGQVSIPLLRIRNGKARWYGLKDSSKKNYARGSSPRIQLEMSLVWSPPKASLKLFRPKAINRAKAGMSNIALVHKNIEFIKDSFLVIQEINELFKSLFEWNNVELSFIALLIWLLFWYYFQLWTAPLFLLLPFLYFWIFDRTQQEFSVMRKYCSVNESSETTGEITDSKGLVYFTSGLLETASYITEATEYIASAAERFYNLASFKVPFLSYFTMMLLVVMSIAFYCVPFNYLMMSLGIYKFTRKYLNPQRVLNNDLLDFISHIPDNEILKEWKELKVPEADVEVQSESPMKKLQ
ncbi:hypothetical protein K1T71_003294 [Dendrolimus kikuchii]|uniref:Uncharacterized protein n=1 Tax=Dendrolimus kikuchii TaxID=765133 RepID=A0ACC1DBT2_9NEOP|nr:hypothetical protein K1T71_003294 [Dendrolimus kikuchii]